MFELYITNKNYSSWSLRPWVLMRHLNIPFTEKLFEFRADGRQSGFDRFSPTAKVPCLKDGDELIWESLAIVEYLAERFPGIWPEGAPARSWARCAAAEMHAGFTSLRNTCSMSCGVRVKLYDFSGDLKRDVTRIDYLWNEGLERFGGPFLAGATFTGVDAFFAPVAFRAQTYGFPLSESARQYQTRLLALPVMLDWYEAGLQETWRDENHEEEVRHAGHCIQDLRARE